MPEPMLLKEALRQEPEGKFCAFCKNLNTFVDDGGFFHVDLTYLGNSKGFICKSCWFYFSKKHKELINYFGER